MSLKEYARKRTFSRTPEPPPAAEQTSSAMGRRPAFVVQRHHARRLHYDFRLEMDGALKSWAVPKGPTLDPAAKRLAVEVEDHPLDYGGFEGNIPAGAYGAGSVMVWDRGTYEVLGYDPPQDQYRRGDFKFRLDGQKLRGEFALVRTKGRGENQWLLIKKHDASAVVGWDPEDHSRSALSGRSQEEIAREERPLAGGKGASARGAVSSPAVSRIDPATLPGAVAAEFPASITPMLAQAAETPPEGSDWLYEIKWDGMRILLFLNGKQVRLLTRRGNDCVRQFPELTAAHQWLAAEQAVVDGEVVVLDERGRPSFPLLQPRIMTSDPGAIAQLTRSRPAVFCVFDLLYLDGYDLRGVPLLDRKHALEEVLNPDSVIRLSEHIIGSGSSGAEFLEAARAQELEGIVAKRAGSLYQSRRSSDWLKIKIASQQEFVICGYTEGERDSFGSLVLGLYENGKLLYVGNLGTGFDAPMLRALAEQLGLLATSRSPFPQPIQLVKPAPVTWVRPELVCTARFNSWTPEGRLRSPVFLGLRPDIEPAECLRGGAHAEPAEPVTPPGIFFPRR